MHNMVATVAAPSRRDWTLLAIAAARGGPLTPVQLQKSLFLLGKQFPDELGPGFYRFEPYNYGPFSKQVYVDAEELGRDGLVAFTSHSGGRWLDYVATPAGTRQASDVGAHAPPNLLAYLARVVNWSSEQSFPNLLRWIYAKYPEYRAKSIFTD